MNSKLQKLKEKLKKEDNKKVFETSKKTYLMYCKKNEQEALDRQIAYLERNLI